MCFGWAVKTSINFKLSRWFEAWCITNFIINSMFLRWHTICDNVNLLCTSLGVCPLNEHLPNYNQVNTGDCKVVSNSQCLHDYDDECQTIVQSMGERAQLIRNLDSLRIGCIPSITYIIMLTLISNQNHSFTPTASPSFSQPSFSVQAFWEACRQAGQTERNTRRHWSPHRGRLIKPDVIG